jgi:hypothetical protein
MQEKLFFLSILFNTLGGYTLFTEKPAITGEAEETAPPKSAGKILLGLAAVAAGVLKLFFPMKGPPVIGDFIPAIAGILSGGMLFYSFYKSHQTLKGEDNESAARLFVLNRKWIGLLGIASGLLQFLFPRALFF